MFGRGEVVKKRLVRQPPDGGYSGGEEVNLKGTSTKECYLPFSRKYKGQSGYTANSIFPL